MAIRIMALTVCASALFYMSASAGMQEMADRFLRMGRDAMNNRDWVDCIENLNQVIEIDDEYLDAYLDLAYCQQEMKQWEDAADTYDDALDVAPDDRIAEIKTNMAYAKASSGDLKGAAKAYAEVCKSTPDDKNCWASLGHVFSGLNDTVEALEAYRQAHEIDPTDVEILKTYAELNSQAGMDEQAIQAYERLAEVVPSDMTAWRQLGFLYAKLGTCDRGIAVFDKLLAADDSNPGDLLNAGQLAQKCGDPGKTAEYWGKYRELRPGDSAIDCRLLFLKEDTGEALEGIKLAKDALSKFPGDGCILMAYGRLLDLRGRQLQDQKKYDDAVTRFQEAIAQFQKVLGDATHGAGAQKQIERAEQLIIRAQKLKQRNKDGFE